MRPVLERRGLAALMLAGALAGAVSFASVLRFGFVYDDHWTLVQSRVFDQPLRALLSAAAHGTAKAEGIPDATRPAMTASVWLDHRLFGLRAPGYHAHSLLDYALVCALGALVLFALSRRRRVALLGAIVFAAAPLHAEVVASINYREDLIAAAGVILPLAALAGPWRWPRGTPGAVALGAIFLTGLCGKESAVALLPLLCVAWAIRRPSRAALRGHEPLLLALGGALVLWLNWRLALRLGGDDVPTAPPSGTLAVLLDTARFEVRAVLESVMLVRTAPEHAREAAASATWLLGLAGLLWLVVVLARRRVTRTPAIGIAIALAAALPTSPLVGPANTRADRYLFLAVLGAALCWGWLLDRLLARLPRAAAALLFAAGAIGLGFACHTAAAPWRSDLSLWTVAVAKAPSAPRAWVGLSRARRVEGDFVGADAAIERAVALDPSFVQAHVTRAYGLLARGSVDAARREVVVIDSLGGAEHRGMKRARRCATLSARAAPACIGAP